MKLEITITNGFLEYLKNFETADAAYLAAQDALFDHLDADDNQWDALKSVRDSAQKDKLLSLQNLPQISSQETERPGYRPNCCSFA